MKPLIKKALLAATAAGLVVSMVAGRERPSVPLIEPAARTVSQESFDLPKLERPEAEEVRADPFARRSFEPSTTARPASQKPAAPAAPVAPPLPFQYIGTLTQDGKTEVLVTRGDELISIAPGQTIDEYRVDQVTESSIGFTYLPLKAKQTLDRPGFSG